MEGELEPRWQTDPARLRISDTERHQVAEILREAAGEGRLDLDELDERLEATYAARTYADLVPLTADLPVRGPAVRPASQPQPRPRGPAGARGPPRQHDRDPRRREPQGRLGARARPTPRSR